MIHIRSPNLCFVSHCTAHFPIPSLQTCGQRQRCLGTPEATGAPRSGTARSLRIGAESGRGDAVLRDTLNQHLWQPFFPDMHSFMVRSRDNKGVSALRHKPSTITHSYLSFPCGELFGQSCPAGTSWKPRKSHLEFFSAAFLWPAHSTALAATCVCDCSHGSEIKSATWHLVGGREGRTEWPGAARDHETHAGVAGARRGAHPILRPHRGAGRHHPRPGAGVVSEVLQGPHWEGRRAMHGHSHREVFHCQCSSLPAYAVQSCWQS